MSACAGENPPAAQAAMARIKPEARDIQRDMPTYSVTGGKKASDSGPTADRGGADPCPELAAAGDRACRGTGRPAQWIFPWHGICN